MTKKLPQRAAAISGVGQSKIGRRLERGGLDLTLDAALQAIDHAGLSLKDIDGVSTWPGLMAASPGFSPVGVRDLKEALRLELNWYSGGIEAPGQYGAIINAAAAVSLGLARHVLCFRTVTESSAQAALRKKGGGRGELPAGYQWQLPFNAYSAANWLALVAQRHFYEYGTTREQMAQIALVSRENAELNLNAVYRDPLTMDDYMQARWISTPFCLYDCDVPADGSTAVIVSSPEAAADLRKPPIYIEAIGCALHDRDSWDQNSDLTSGAAADAGKMLWERTDYTPKNVDVAELYDGFSINTMIWLEALGFCAKGESGAFIEGGDRIRRTGELPLNTHGGQLSAGRTHGFGFFHEACTQLWGEGGERQVPDAHVAVTAAGGGPLGGCMLLTRD